MQRVRRTRLRRHDSVHAIVDGEVIDEECLGIWAPLRAGTLERQRTLGPSMLACRTAFNATVPSAYARGGRVCSRTYAPAAERLEAE